MGIPNYNVSPYGGGFTSAMQGGLGAKDALGKSGTALDMIGDFFGGAGEALSGMQPDQQGDPTFGSASHSTGALGQRNVDTTQLMQLLSQYSGRHDSGGYQP